MDPELLALQNQLASLQEEEAKVTLSTSNCIELVNKLVKMGKLDVSGGSWLGLPLIWSCSFFLPFFFPKGNVCAGRE
jgi:hypothetical protein